ncbi:putative LRR receptor-like serine/threonine-protein kinase RPK1 [Tasmannia lanceolata]|uniref:putative LRR receptor-like serine/threonine-protein kinase RPK1 n=1 Tax=Tasmannia lanceolata TaxID=3420 RepID=UPI00406438EC
MKAKNLCNEISQLDEESKISESRIRRMIIRGLRAEFSSFITGIRGWPTQPSLLELENILINQEMLAKQMAGLSVKENEEALAVNSKRKWQSYNQLSGELSPSWAECQMLTSLKISGNLIGGREISPQLGKLHMLEILNISHNKLIGTIPSSLAGMVSLTSIDLSYNNLVGSLPNSNPFQQGTFVGNKGLCGKAQVFCIFFIFRRRRGNAKEERNEMNIDLFSIWNWDGCISYEDIINSTEDFDDKYCIGEGGYGRVYRVSLPTEQVVAVKKLHKLEEGEQIDPLSEMSRCMFLVYEYMERGNLANILSSEEGAMELDWVKRVNIIKAVAHSLSYMHHD